MANRTPITIRLPTETYEALRKLAYKQRVSMNQLTTEAVQDKVAKGDQP